MMKRKKKKLPGLSGRLINLLTIDRYCDCILGDLDEFYSEIIAHDGKIKAFFWLWLQVVATFSMFFRESIYRSIAMFKNYFKITVRNLLKDKIYTLINVFGLSIGIACCILIYFFIQNEMSYDRFHEDIDNTYLTVTKIMVFELPATPGPMSAALERDYPEVLSSIRIYEEELAVGNGNKLFKEKILLTDPDFFSFFSFKLKEGSKENVLSNVNNVVISEDAAIKYFGDGDPLGRTISIKVGSSVKTFMVSGIAENQPSNSSIKFDFITLFHSVKELYPENEIDNDWGAFGYSTFVKLLPGTSNEEFSVKVTKEIDKYYEDKDEKDLENKEFFFHPFKDYHLASYGGGNGMEGQSDPIYSYILSGIALLILLIACFNFMNLSLGRSSTRFKEIGLRKVVGAKRKQLIRQFLFESVSLGIIALVTGIILAEVFNPTFNTLSEKQISLDYITDPLSIVFIITVILISSIITGSYPAFMLSGLKTTEILKGSQRIGGKNMLTRTLVIFQFALSVILIVGTLIMNDQQKFINNKDHGFEKDNVIVIPTFADITDPNAGDRMLQYFREQTVSDSDVLDISGSSSSFNRSLSARLVNDENVGDKLVNVYKVDYNYLDFMRIELIEGRFFERDQPSDLKNTIVVNEAFIKTFGIENPINHRFSGYLDEEDVTIIGVAKDFHVIHLRAEIGPLAFTIDPNIRVRYLLLKTAPESSSDALKRAEELWKEIKPFQPFEYYYLDDDVMGRYDNDRRWSQIITISSVFAVFIASLGLFGLANISVSRRIKEIGIRKVLGARISQIIAIMNREFIIMILIGNIIAWPAGYYIMNKWLQSFQYRIDLQISSFILAGVLVLSIAFGTICIQVIRAAVTNPVDSIRYE